MITENSPLDSAPVDPRRGRRVAALVLLALSGFALLSPPVAWSWRGGLILPMGVVFLVWAALMRSRGLLVPGGVLSGVGAGLALLPEFGPAALLFGMAGGFLLVAFVSRLLFGRGCAWWPLWPAAGLAIAGSAALGGGELREVWRAIGPFWPYAALASAVWLFFLPGRKSA